MSVDERVARSVELEQAYVHDVYEQFSDNYTGKPWPAVQRFIEDLEPGSVICDVGCGTGKYFNVNNSIFNVGGDRCLRLCEVAREKENEVLVLDNLALPFRDDSLDAVISIAVVHHFATTERRICALQELARVLKIGGRLIISVWAMEQTHRKFESQDVLVPWHRSHHFRTPSLEFTSATNTSEDDGLLPYHAYTSDSDSNKSSKTPNKRVKTKHKGCSIDPNRSSYPSSTSLSSPNETCYSFVRRAIQKLAGSRRVGMHRPWFLDSWNTCSKDRPPKRYDPDGCECCENIQDIPIELRRLDEEDPPQRRKTFPSSQIMNNLYGNVKSKSMTNMKTVENNNVISETEKKVENRTKPKLVKQKKSVCDDDADEALDVATDMKTLVRDLPDFKVLHIQQRGSVFKQRSLNEELMSTERLKEKERVKQNIQKQTSLNEELMYTRRHTFDSFRNSFFSVSTSTRFQLIKTGFTNKIKNSTTNIEKVTGSTLKNGFVRMFQNWKSTDLNTEIGDEEEGSSGAGKKVAVCEEKKDTENIPERRHSKEDGSDSSKDSSLQSDTSVDSEDSFASVIFIPKSDPMSPIPLSPGPTSPRVINSTIPKVKQSSCPTSPRIKQTPLISYPLKKQLSSPSETKSERDQSWREKYSCVQQIPKFRRTSLNSPDNVADNRNERLKKIREMLTQKSDFGVRPTKSHFPIVRHSSESSAKPLPKLLSLEIFNPETDDKDSDSSAVSSPDSVDSVISGRKKFNFSRNEEKTMTLLEAAADVANSLDRAVQRVIKSNPNVKLRPSEIRSVMERKYAIDGVREIDHTVRQSLEAIPLLDNDECQRHLTDFADELSEKLFREINEAKEGSDDPYIHRLSAELQDLSKLSAEIQKQNEYLAKLSASDSLLKCVGCKSVTCQCRTVKDNMLARCNLKKEKTQVNSVSIKSSRTDGSIASVERCKEENGSLNGSAKLSASRSSIRTGNSSDSYDSERGSSSTNSLISNLASSVNGGRSLESADFSDRGSADSYKDSLSRCSYEGSTASLASCPEWKTIREKSSETKEPEKRREKSGLSDVSQESLPSDNVGGEITYHRYYHVFREGELDQLIEKYVQNLHIISSYYDHASWCVVAEKVQVWTI